MATHQLAPEFTGEDVVGVAHFGGSSGKEFGFNTGNVDEDVKLMLGTVVRGVVMSFCIVASPDLTPSNITVHEAGKKKRKQSDVQ